MNCERIEELLSARFDGDLPAEDCSAFDAHVASCARCGADWADYRAAVGVLRGSGAAETSPDLYAATLAAVAQAGNASVRPRRTLPLLLLASIVGAAAALFVGWLMREFGWEAGRDAGRSLEVLVATDLVALQPGETRVVGGVVVSRSAAGQLSVRAEPSAPTIVDRVVEVPVERVVERIREVPVERVVERVVEVPVRRGPLFAIDGTALAAALRDAARQVGSGMQAMAAAQRSPSPAQAVPQGSVATVLPTARLAAAPSAPAPVPAPRGATLQVSRRDGRLMLEVAGTLEELVPALLCHLSTADAELQALIERQLATIHEQAAEDPAIRAALAAMPGPAAEPATDVPSLFGGRRTPEAVELPAAAWAAWWDANGGLITQSAGL